MIDMEQKKLQISLSDSNRPHVEGKDEYVKSVFKQQYDLCFGMLNSILASNKNISYNDGREYNNNIIVFDGERGSGKTSCMLSFAKMLTEDGDFIANLKDFHELQNQKFIRLPMLEPSFFDKEHNAVTLFVSRLYKEYLESDRSEKNIQTKHDLLNQFVAVQQSIKCIFGDFEPKDGLEYLVGLSSAVDLRKDIYDLVNKFLIYEDKSNHKLLILIDDIDINPEMAEDMAEQIRKYLVLPNTIVLISMKISQMTGILMRSYAKEYAGTYLNSLEIEDKEEINNRVDKYITKLFPRTQRVFMPQPNLVLNCPLEIKEASHWKYNLLDTLPVKQIVPELIFKKTRYLFYNTNLRESFIVPRNLRDLRQLLQLLLQMPDYNREYKHIENKLAFKKYFFEDWIISNLTENHRNLAYKLYLVERSEELNYTTVHILKNLSGSLPNNNAAVPIFETLNNTANISLGDVLSLIRTLENSEPDESIRKMLFFIRTLYSIRLYEAYNSIEEDNMYIMSNNDGCVINRGVYRLVRNDYEAIVGGTVYNSSLFDILPKVSDLVRISSRTISKESIVALANMCVSNWSAEEGCNYIKLMEIIMLSVYYDNTLSESVQGNFRCSDSICYRSVNIGSTSYMFDLGALLFNLCRIDDAVDRFRAIPDLQDFFNNYDKNKNNYLKSALYNSIYIDNESYDEQKWRSLCCFRNMEILEDFLDYIKGNLMDYIDSKDYLDRMKPEDAIYAFFEMASDYKIKSYDRPDCDNNSVVSEINFKFYGEIANLLNNENIKREFATIFNSKEHSQFKESESITQ